MKKFLVLLLTTILAIAGWQQVAPLEVYTSDGKVEGINSFKTLKDKIDEDKFFTRHVKKLVIEEGDQFFTPIEGTLPKNIVTEKLMLNELIIKDPIFFAHEKPFAFLSENAGLEVLELHNFGSLEDLKKTDLFEEAELLDEIKIVVVVDGEKSTLEVEEVPLERGLYELQPHLEAEIAFVEKKLAEFKSEREEKTKQLKSEMESITKKPGLIKRFVRWLASLYRGWTSPAAPEKIKITAPKDFKKMELSTKIEQLKLEVQKLTNQIRAQEEKLRKIMCGE